MEVLYPPFYPTLDVSFMMPLRLTCLYHELLDRSIVNAHHGRKNLQGILMMLEEFQPIIEPKPPVTDRTGLREKLLIASGSAGLILPTCESVYGPGLTAAITTTGDIVTAQSQKRSLFSLYAFCERTSPHCDLLLRSSCYARAEIRGSVRWFILPTARYVDAASASSTEETVFC